MHILYCGDSDISKWPLPAPSQSVHEPALTPTSSRLAKSGWTIKPMEQQIDYTSRTTAPPFAVKDVHPDQYIVVSTVGENDLSSSTDSNFIQLTASRILATVDKLAVSRTSEFKGLLFFGPKLEPWMFGEENDFDAMLAYARLNARLNTAFDERPEYKYVDCLMMFTDKESMTSADAMQAIAAKRVDFAAQEDLFQQDKLHLSSSGYKLWEALLEVYASASS